MDRLAEISRPKPQNRNDATDFTRPHGTRTERREAGETRNDERVSDRERTERANEKPESFSVRLAEQKASLEPIDGSAQPVEPESATANGTDTADSGAPSEPSDVEGKPQPEQADAVAPKNPAAPAALELAPQIEAPSPALPAVVETHVKQDGEPAPAPLAPTAPLPAALAAAPGAAQPASAPAPAAAEPAITAAPRIDTEKPVLEAESPQAKIGAQPAEGRAHHVQDPAPARETAIEVPRSEAPREAPAARSAQEVERAAEILRQIRVQITPQLSEARIQLQPLELGRVSIHLSLDNGRMKTVVRAEKTETLQAIQTHLPELRATLRQHGIDAQEFQLSLGFENRPARDGDQTPAQPNTRHAAREATAIERSPSLRAAVAKTGVDIYA